MDAFFDGKIVRGFLTRRAPPRPLTLVCYTPLVTITLPPDQRQWLEAQVAAGHFPSVDEAVQAAVAEMMALATEDFEWARPYIEEADASLARGEGIPGAQFLERLDRRLNALR